MYTSGNYGRPPVGAQQGAVQYPGMQQGGMQQGSMQQGGMQYPGIQQGSMQPRQPQQPAYASPQGGPPQTPTGSSLAPRPMSGGLPDAPAAPQPSALAPFQAPLARSLAPQPVTPAPVSQREQMLEQKVRQLEQTVAEKEAEIQDLRSALADARAASSGPKIASARGPARSGSGFRKTQSSNPVVKYQAIDQDDPVDIRLEEFYNTTDSAIQFKRINKGFYRFGDSIVELDIINHKLMAKTEDGWNRGKFGPVEKFLMYYENIERERMGIVDEA